MPLHVDHNRDPYLKLIDTIGPHEIWLVDGGWVRQHKEEEFTNYGHGRDPMFRGKIPMNEFWIEVGSNPDEFPFFIDRMLSESYYLSKLMPHLKAERKSMEVENRSRQRARSDRGEYRDKGVNVHLNELKFPNLKNQNIRTWVVDGKKVRDSMDNFFCHGGHWLVYPDYVPSLEVWVDGTAPRNEHDFLLIHEFNECYMMADGKSYEKAHPIASKIEYQCRWSLQEKDKQMHELGMK